jgi:hypothetical protein
MQEDRGNQLTKFLLGLAGTALVLGVGTVATLKLLPAPAPPPPTQLPPLPLDPEGTIHLAPPADGAPSTTPENSRFEIIESITGNPNPIRYTGEGFQPRQKTIQASDPLGCLVTLINGTAEPLRVGVGPHADRGDPGADYGVIPPQESKFLDVRYPGLTEIELHNHARPRDTLYISYGSGCR